MRGLKFVLDMAKRYDAETHLLDLRDTKLPFFDPDGSTKEYNLLSDQMRKITDY